MHTRCLLLLPDDTSAVFILGDYFAFEDVRAVSHENFNRAIIAWSNTICPSSNAS